MLASAERWAKEGAEEQGCEIFGPGGSARGPVLSMSSHNRTDNRGRGGGGVAARALAGWCVADAVAAGRSMQVRFGRLGFTFLIIISVSGIRAGPKKMCVRN